MDWELLIKLQAKAYKAYLSGYKESRDQLTADKSIILGSYTEKTAPENVRNKIQRDVESWQQEWGIDGTRYKEMEALHQQQLEAYFRSE